MKFTRREAIAGGIGGLLFTAIGAKAALAQSGPAESVLRLASTKAATRLDPHIDVAWEVLMVLSAVYDTLVYQDKSGTIVPGLATEWQISEDGLTHEMALRDDVTFHDGTPFNADAVKFNFERIKALGPRSLKAGSLVAAVDNVEVVSPTKVRIHMSEPDGDLLFSLSLTYLAMVSPTAAEEWGDEYHTHQAGTGPYKFTEYVIGEKYTLAKNPDYNWAPSSFASDGPALVDTLEWRFLPEPSSRSVALLAGDFDIVFDLPPTSLKQVTASSDYDVAFARLTGQPAYWFINTQKSPTDDLAVRHALLYGVNMEAGVKSVMRGAASAAKGPLSKTTPEYDPSLDAMYSFDPGKAAALLDEAGWTDRDGEGYRAKGGESLVLEVEMASWGNSEPFSIFLQSALKDLGIKVNLEMMSYPVGIQAGRDGTKNMIFTGGSGFSAGDSLMPFFLGAYADDGFAFSKYKDAELDAVMEEAKATISDAERTKLYQQVQSLIMEKALILPIYDYSLPIGVSKDIKGLDFGAVGLVPNVHDATI